MTPPRTYPYAIYYDDGSYLVWDLTKQDFEKLTKAVGKDAWVHLSIGILCLTQIRAIIEQREPEVIEELEGANPDLPLSYMNFLKGSEEV